MDSIVNERLGGAQQQVSRAGARGSLSDVGSNIANETLLGQQEGVRERVGDVGSSVLGGYSNELQAIKDRATTANQGFILGDDRFDVTPFATERGDFLSGTDVAGGVTRALGSDPLFGLSSALLEGGRSQGLVSGTSGSENFLDTLAAREKETGLNKARRGLGSRGSGVF